MLSQIAQTRMENVDMLKHAIGAAIVILAASGESKWVVAQNADAKLDAQASVKEKQTANANANADFEVVTRGPIHEAFATQYQLNATPGAIIDREPPQPIDELPAPAKPSGESVVWIPGYWSWDAVASDFLWVSGTYRNAPPNQRWMPGYWAKVATGYQWTSGFWIDAATTTMNYYSPPPQSQERGPSSPAPGEDYFWAPGSYVPTGEKYAWQPGYWVPYQANYVWTPGRNVQTPGGYIHLPGYWDHRLDQRGALFAPVRLNTAANVAANSNLRLTPETLIPFATLQFHLFSQANSNTYLFGDYYGDAYAAQGIAPWYRSQYVKGINDPLFGYYDWAYSRSGTNYTQLLTGWTNHFTANAALRPAATLAAQLDLAKSTANADQLTQSLLGVPLLGANSTVPAGFVNVSATDRTALAGSLKELRLLSENRLKLESSAAGAAHIGAAANTALQVAATPLNLPRVEVPLIRSVPAAPAEIVRGVGNAAGGVIRGATGAVPNVVPGVLPGGQSGGLVPGVLPPVAPGGGVLPGGILPGRGDDGGGGLLPLP